MRISSAAWRSVLLPGVLAFLATSPAAHASTIVYATAGPEIYAWNTGTNAISPVFPSATGGYIDSIILDTTGDLIYTIIGSQSIGKFNFSTLSNTVLASGGNFYNPADMVLDPSLTTFLVSNAMGDTIDRVNIATGATTTFYSGALETDGLAYDSSGDLFAVLGTDEVAQLNPVTGAIIKTVSTPNQADGMTYDAATGMLYVASDGGGFYTVPTNLSSATFTPVSGSPVFDGIASSGNLLYFAVRDTNAVVYNLGTGAITETGPAITDADDVAVAVATPEPGSVLLLGTGLLGLAWLRKRKA